MFAASAGLSSAISVAHDGGFRAISLNQGRMAPAERADQPGASLWQLAALDKQAEQGSFLATLQQDAAWARQEALRRRKQS